MCWCVLVLVFPWTQIDDQFTIQLPVKRIASGTAQCLMMSIDENQFDLESSLLPLPGLHPRLNLRVSASGISLHQLPSPPCLISILFEEIPTSLFVDRFQLETLSGDSHLELVSHETEQPTLHTVHPLTWGSRDLEAPQSLASTSGLLIPLSKFTRAIRNRSMTMVELEVPFHVRYLDPLASFSPGQTKVILPSPSLVWSCKPCESHTHLLVSGTTHAHIHTQSEH